MIESSVERQPGLEIDSAPTPDSPSRPQIPISSSRIRGLERFALASVIALAGSFLVSAPVSAADEERVPCPDVMSLDGCDLLEGKPVQPGTVVGRISDPFSRDPDAQVTVTISTFTVPEDRSLGESLRKPTIVLVPLQNP